MKPIRYALAVLVVVAGFTGCGAAAEGESCDLSNGNDDCEDGLICRGAWEVAASKSVCCPRPPGRPTVSACEPPLGDEPPDPSVDAASIPPGTGGAGGAGGSGGAAGAAGGGGAAGAAGSAGSDAGGSDAGGSDAGSSDASDATTG